MFLEMAAGLLFVFGVAGMALAALGLYGLVSYTVKQSTHEIGIRMALGARSVEVVWQFLGAGCGSARLARRSASSPRWPSTRLLGSVLYGVSATDPMLVRRRARGPPRRRDRRDADSGLAGREDADR